MTMQKGKRGNPKVQKTGTVTDSNTYELQMAKLGNCEQCLSWNVDKCERGLTRIVTLVCNDFKHWRSDERNCYSARDTHFIAFTYCYFILVNK